MRLSFRATANWASTPPRLLKKHKPATVMGKEEFRRLCTRLDINDNAVASELLGPSWRTCQRYWYGELPVPPSLARLLRAAVIHNFSHAQLRKLARPVP